MMESPNIKHLGGLILNGSLNCLVSFASGSGTSIIFGLLNAITGNLATQNVERLIKYDKIKNWLKSSDPNKVNHDLERLFRASAITSIGFIEHLFEAEIKNDEELMADSTKNEIKQFIKRVRIFFKEGANELKERILDAEINKEIIKDPQELLNGIFRELVGVSSIKFVHPDTENKLRNFYASSLPYCFELAFKEELKKDDRGFKAFQIAAVEQIQQQNLQIIDGQQKISDEIIFKIKNGINFIDESKLKELLDDRTNNIYKILDNKFENIQNSLSLITIQISKSLEEVNKKLDNNTKTLIELPSKVAEQILNNVNLKWQEQVNNSENRNIEEKDAIEDTIILEPDEIKQYLNILKKENANIQLPALSNKIGKIDLPLDNIYTSLKVSKKISSFELESAYQKYQKAVRSEPNNENEMPELLMGAFEERESINNYPKISKSILLTEAFRDAQILIILGSPGMGKSTILKWLTHSFAKFKLEELEKSEPQYLKIDYNEPYKFALTPIQGIDIISDVKLPLLINISAYSKEYAKRPLHIEEYIGYHLFKNGDGRGFSLNKKILNFLDLGNAAIMLDGLDEVINNRLEIKNEIERFINLYKDNGSAMTLNLSSDPLYVDSHKKLIRNNFIITSRKTGYHQAPLIIKTAVHCTIEDMDEPSIRLFCDNWMRQYEKKTNTSTDEKITTIAIHNANELKNAIFSSKEERIKYLAGNPLLLTIMAIIFKQNGEFPANKIELYQRASETLIEQNLKNILSKFNSSLLSLEGINIVFSNLAYEIHQSKTDDILKSTFANRAKKYLALHNGIKDADELPARLIEEFTREIKENGGVMMASSNDTFRFVHRQIQEYFAATLLLEPFENVGEKIIQRLGDPIWYETILLTLSLINKNYPELIGKTVNDIILHDNINSVILPRSAFFILAALPEISNIPKEKTLQLLIQVLNVYKQTQESDQNNALDNQIEYLFDSIYKSPEKKLLEDAITIFLTEKKYKDKIAAVSFLLFRMSKNGWETHKWTRLLLDKSYYDSDVLNYPMDSLLRTVSKKEETEKVFNLLPLRQYLNRDPDAISFIKRNPKWLRLIIALYGGLENSNFGGDFLEFENLRKEFQEKKGEKDYRKQIAIKLDTKYGKVKSKLGSYPSFDLANIYRSVSPAIDKKIIEFLKSRKNAEDIVTYFVDCLNGEYDNNLFKSNAFIALLSLGYWEQHNENLPNNYIEEINRLKSSLTDSLIHLYGLINSKDNYWKDIFISLEDSKKWSLIDSLFFTFSKAGLPSPLIYYSIPANRITEIDDYVDRCFVESEFWISMMSRSSKDPIYSIAVVIDTSGRKLVNDLDLFLGSLAAIPFSHFLKGSFLGYSWIDYPLLSFYPFNHDKERLIIAALESIQSFPVEFNFVKDWALFSLKPFIDDYPELLPEYLLTALAIDTKDIQNVIKVFPLIWDTIDPLDSVLSLIVELQNPFLQMRSLFKLMTLRGSPIIEELFISAHNKISNNASSEYFIATELFLAFANEISFTNPVKTFQQRSNIAINKRIEDAMAIIDIDDRCTALGILMFKVPGDYRRLAILHSIIGYLPEINDIKRRTYLAQFLNKNFLLKNFENILPYNSIDENWYINIATRQTYKNVYKLIESAPVSSYEGLSSFSLYLACIEIAESLNPQGISTIDDLFNDLIQYPEKENDTLKKIILKGKDGIKISANIASCLQQFIYENKSNIFKSVISYCEKPDNSSDCYERILQWNYPEIREVQLFVSLIQAENNIFNPSIFDDLLVLLQHDDDRLRVRAQVAIHGKYCGNGNHPRRKRVSRFGFENLTYVYDKINELKENVKEDNIHSLSSLNWISHDIFHDDPRIFNYYLYQNRYLINPDTIQKILSSIEKPSHVVFFKVLEHLNNENNHQLLESLLRIVYSKPVIDIRSNITQLLSSKICRYISESDYKNYTFPNIAESLIHVYLQNKDNTENVSLKALVNNCHNYFNQNYTITLEEPYSNESLLETIDRIGSTNLYWDTQKKEKEIELAISKILQHPDCLPLLINWTLEEIYINTYSKNIKSYFDDYLSLLLANFAELNPDTFRKNVDASYAIKILVDAIKFNPSWICRRGAIYLLSYIGIFSEEVNDAYCLALKDVFFVREGVEKCYRYFARIEKDSEIETLLNNLRCNSGLIIASSLKILSDICMSRKTNSAIRKRIMIEITKLLKEYNEDSTLNKGVYFFDDNVQDIKFIGFTVDLLYSELLKISGIN